ncbi:hypothetical protein QJQ45_030149, partial [Haematococcus lacustris]
MARTKRRYEDGQGHEHYRRQQQQQGALSLRLGDTLQPALSLTAPDVAPDNHVCRGAAAKRLGKTGPRSGHDVEVIDLTGIESPSPQKAGSLPIEYAGLLSFLLEDPSDTVHPQASVEHGSHSHNHTGHSSMSQLCHALHDAETGCLMADLQTCAQCDTLTSELVLLRKERAEWQARYEALEREALEWQQDAHSTARKNRELQPRIAELSLQLSKERKQREALMQDKVACLVCWEAM